MLLILCFSIEHVVTKFKYMRNIYLFFSSSENGTNKPVQNILDIHF